MHTREITFFCSLSLSRCSLISGVLDPKTMAMQHTQKTIWPCPERIFHRHLTRPWNIHYCIHIHHTTFRKTRDLRKVQWIFYVFLYFFARRPRIAANVLRIVVVFSYLETAIVFAIHTGVVLRRFLIVISRPGNLFNEERQRIIEPFSYICTKRVCVPQIHERYNSSSVTFARSASTNTFRVQINAFADNKYSTCIHRFHDCHQRSQFRACIAHQVFSFFFSIIPSESHELTSYLVCEWCSINADYNSNI